MPRGRGDMPLLLRQLGVVLFVGYCLFNVANVLYLRANLTYVGLLLAGIGGVFILQRLALLYARGAVATRSEVFGYFLMLLLMMIVLVQQSVLTTNIDFDGVNTLRVIHAATTVSIVWMLIGGAVSMFRLRESFVLAVLLAGALLMMFLVNAQDGFSVTYREIKDDVGTTNVSHITLEKFVVPTLALAYALSSRARLPVVLMAFVTLFLMSGRTSFAAFLLAFLVMSLQGRALRNFSMIVVAVLLIGVSVRLGLESGFIDTENKAVRQMVFMDGLEGDNSFVGRRELLLGGLKDLPAQFLFGDFTLTVERFGKFGTYIHNLLSAWQMYGFFALSAIVAALVVCVVRARAAMRRDPSPATVFGTFMLVYVIIGAIVAKSALWSPLWFVLGFWLLRPNEQTTTRRPARRKRRVRRAGDTGGVPVRVGGAPARAGAAPGGLAVGMRSRG